MIIKFDHISFSCQWDKTTNEMMAGYILDFAETDLLNIDAKKRFLQVQSEKHNISLFRAENKYPIEITAYPVCIGTNHKYEVSDDMITVYSSCPERTLQFYETFGFKRISDATLEVLPFMEKRTVRLKVEVADTEDVFLDKNGFGSLAFVVDRIEKYKQLFEKKGYEVSEINSLTVNDKELRICFAADNVGDIIELIGVK